MAAPVAGVSDCSSAVEPARLIVWDDLPTHCSRVVRQHVESLNRQIALERLPACAPELIGSSMCWATLSNASWLTGACKPSPKSGATPADY